MAIRRNRKKSHWQRRAMALGFCTLFCLGQGCYEQKVVDRDTFGPVPDGDEYEVDIYLISELAGRFLAQKKSGETVICGDFGKEGTETNTCAMPSFLFYESPIVKDGENAGVWNPSDGDGKFVLGSESSDVVIASNGEGGNCQYTLKIRPYYDSEDEKMSGRTISYEIKAKYGETDFNLLKKISGNDLELGWGNTEEKCVPGDAVCSNTKVDVYVYDVKNKEKRKDIGANVCRDELEFKNLEDNKDYECRYRPYYDYFESKLDDSKYKCYNATYSYATTGVDNIYRVWDKYYGHTPKKDSNAIRVGAGDSYGVSIPQSSAFNDIPTVQTLNDMLFSADTLGNHSFDTSLDFMNQIVEEAKYNYVSSNMAFMAQNLNNRARRYAIYDIKPKNGNGNPLQLAVLGATDPGVVRSVFPGRFGTIEFGKNYCELLQAMELAYNRNARAFLILGHVYTERTFLNKFLNELFILNDKTLAKEDSPAYKVVKENSWKVEEQLSLDLYDHVQSIATYCPSKLIVDKDEIAELKKLNPEKTKSELEDMLIVQKRRDIFSGLIGVFGDASGEPELYEYKKLGTNSDQYEQFFDDQVANQLSYRRLDHKTFYGSMRADYSTGARNDEKDSVSYFRIPKNGEYTGRVKAVLKPNPSEGEGVDTHGYRATIVKMDVQPVVGDMFEYDTPSGCSELSETSGASCANYFDLVKKAAGLLRDDAGNDPADAPDVSVDNNDNNDNNDNREETYRANMLLNDKYRGCYNSIIDYEPAKDKLYDNLKKLRESDAITGHKYAEIYLNQLRWACTYNITSKKSCIEDDRDDSKCSGDNMDKYYSPYIFKFSNDKIDQEDKSTLRKRTTITGNILTLAVWDLLNGEVAQDDSKEWRHFYDQLDKTSGGQGDNTHGTGDETTEPAQVTYDVVYLNAGGIVGGKEYDGIDLDWVLQQLPYGNTVRVVSNTNTKLLVRFIEHGLTQKGGAFPMVGGIVFSYDGNNRVCEIWKTKEDIYNNDYRVELDEILYYLDAKSCQHIAEVNFAESGSSGKYNITGHSSNLFTLNADSDSLAGRTEFDMVDSEGYKSYTSTKSINVLIPDFLATGGDSYGKIYEELSDDNIQMRASFIPTVSKTATTDEIILAYYRNIQKKEKEWKKNQNDELIGKFNDAFLKAVCLNRIYNNDRMNTCVNNTICTTKLGNYCKEKPSNTTKGSSQDTE